jgi:outer membrane protein assembly factor BamB
MTGHTDRPMLRFRSFHLLATLALAILAAPSAAGAAYDESTAYQINPGHTAFASGGSLERPPLRQRWSRTLGTRTSYPLVADGRVYLISYDGQHAGGTLHALDGATGATVWARSVTGFAQIAYDSGRVFIAEETGNVVAVRAETGATSWIRRRPSLGRAAVERARARPPRRRALPPSRPGSRCRRACA